MSKLFKGKRKLLLFLPITLTAAGGYFYFKPGKDKDTVQYSTSQVEKGTLQVSVSAGGSVAAVRTAEVNPGISGEVTEVLVAEGNRVEKEQVLFKIKNDNLEASRSKAYVSYLQAKESLEKAKLDKLSAEESLNDLKEQNDEDNDSVTDLQMAIAEQKVRSAELSIQSAENQVWSTGLSYQNAKEQSAKREVTSPIAGTVTSLEVSVGDELGSTTQSSSSATATVAVSDLSNLVVQVSVSEVDIVKVKKVQKATITLDAFPPTQKFTGTLVGVEYSGTNTQGVVTYRVEIGFDSLSEGIKPGMTASAEIITERKENVLLVNNSAIKTKGEDSFVQILSADGEPTDVTVQLGLSSSQQTEVLEGLNEGDTVISGTVSETGGSGFGGGGGFGIPGMGGMMRR